MAASFVTDSSILAQSSLPPSFPLPDSVASGTTIRIDGSPSMTAVNQALKQRFEEQYAGTDVEIGDGGSRVALQALLDRRIDLVAIGRPLTDEEKAQGLVEVPISRSKIAIIVGENNSFTGDLRFDQFAQIFRGEITDWSQVGGDPGAIRLVDRPETSDTRQAFPNYPVFQVAPFQTGANVVEVDDSTEAVISALGTDGISYAVAEQVFNRSGVRILSMHQTLPDDPRYPFSQPMFYVYREEPNLAIAAFLGFATAPVGQQAVSTAIASGTFVSPSPTADGLTASLDAAPVVTAPSPVVTAPDADVVPGESPNVTLVPAPGADVEVAPTDRGGGLFWWLLPIAAAGGGLFWWLKNRRTDSLPTDRGDRPTPPVEPPPIAGATLAERTGTVVAADRTSIEAAFSEPVAPEPAASPKNTIIPAIGAAMARGGIVAGATLAGLAGIKRPRQSRIILTPRSHNQAYAYWETSEAEMAALRHQGGTHYTLRLRDVTDVTDITDVSLDQQPSHQIQAYECLEADRDRHVPIVQSDRDYLAEIGYFTDAHKWLLLARSKPVRVAAAITPTVDRTEPTPLPPQPMPIERPEATPMSTEPTLANDTPILNEMATTAFAAAELAGFTDMEGLSQESVEAARFDVGQSNLEVEDLAGVDEHLTPLPGGYGESQIVLLPRDPFWAYTYWDVPNERKQALRQRGGVRLALRFYDVTDIDLDHQRPHSLQQYECDEFVRDWYIPVPISDRDYLVEIGYVADDGRWLVLARSLPVRIPPMYPSDWYEEQFVTISWDDSLQDKTVLELVPPAERTTYRTPIYDKVFEWTKSADAQRVTGLMSGSVQHVPDQAVSSHIFPSGIGAIALLTESGIGMSGIGMSGVGLTESGVGMSGVGMSGIGLVSVTSLTESGIGRTESGIGMSGIGFVSVSRVTESGIGMSGVGLTESGVGMSGIGLVSVTSLTESGIGRTESGIGMSGIGLAMSVPTMSGIGLTESGIGMSGIGLLGLSRVTESGIGLTESGIGMMMSGIGLAVGVPTMSGIGLTASGVGMSGIGLAMSVPTMSGIGLTESGIGMMMSGVGMSGIGFAASMPPIRPRRFWLVANAELIVHGATEPDATVMIGDRVVKLDPDGRFRFQVAFPDGMIDYPILAIAVDGEQTRAIHMEFSRETPTENTNTKEEALDEWLA
ncbi:MAG: DUF4912 domain-containing protein [Cyanobacteria bacterium RU_5_0]|nr:DUF4912 domain-containing protein [Cyanobacteria bacterium RU_5_0]